jgi:hypothetical protein
MAIVLVGYSRLMGEDKGPDGVGGAGAS